MSALLRLYCFEKELAGAIDEAGRGSGTEEDQGDRGEKKNSLKYAEVRILKTWYCYPVHVKTKFFGVFFLKYCHVLIIMEFFYAEIYYLTELLSNIYKVCICMCVFVCVCFFLSFSFATVSLLFSFFSLLFLLLSPGG